MFRDCVPLTIHRFRYCIILVDDFTMNYIGICSKIKVGIELFFPFTSSMMDVYQKNKVGTYFNRMLRDEFFEGKIPIILLQFLVTCKKHNVQG